MGLLTHGATLNERRYLIKRLLGQGGMGAVYLADDSRLDTQVAVKENLDIAVDSQRQFKLEAQILSKLHHPGLPRVTDYFIEPSGKQYLVMDYVDGQDLEALIGQRAQLPSEQEVLFWVERICDALQYLHEQPHPIIHRDIKPANVKLTPSGEVVLVDFGIAKAHRPGHRTVAGARGVTPGFSPQEQYGGGNTDQRSDIYALGATMYCLLTRQVPPEAISRPTASLTPRLFNPAISPMIEQIILKSMALRPVDRYQSAREMKAAVTTVAAPTSQGPAVSLSGGASSIACLQCGTSNRYGARFCRGCGGAISYESKVSSSPVPPVPQTNEPVIAAWSLLGLGGMTLFAAFFWPGWGLVSSFFWLANLLASFLALIAARDLLNLFDRYRYRGPPYLSTLYGDLKRGRQLGIISVVLIFVVYLGQLWLVLPLVPLLLASYIFRVLMGDEAVQAFGDVADQPPGVRVTSWALILSGIGTLPGVALLISKSWAVRGTICSLVLIAVLSGIGFGTTLVSGVLADGNSNVLSREVPASFLNGQAVRAYALTSLCYMTALLVGAVAAIRYFKQPTLQVTATPASFQRELRVIGWLLLILGIILLFGPLLMWPPEYTIMPRPIIFVTAGFCVMAGRDLLQLFQGRQKSIPSAFTWLFGSPQRGQKIGIVAAILSALVFIGLSWLVVPLALALLMMYFAYVLTRAVLGGGGTMTRLLGVTLIGWFLIPTGIGTLPGIGMLVPKPWARKLSIGALSLLMLGGIGLFFIALYHGFRVPPNGSYLAHLATIPFLQLEIRTRTLSTAAYTLAGVVACGGAIHYLRSPSLRSYFGA